MQLQTLVTVAPNPASSHVTVNLYVGKNSQIQVSLIDKVGRKVLVQNESVTRGFNNITLNLDKYSEGVYALVIETGSEKITKQIMIIR